MYCWHGQVQFPRAQPPSQSHSWRGVLLCATFRPLKSPLSSHFMSLLFSCTITILHGSQRLFFPSHLFLLQQVVASPSAPEEGTWLLSEAISAVPVFPGEVVSTRCLGMGLNTVLTAPCAQIQEVIYWECKVFKASPVEASNSRSGSACTIFQNECCHAG